MRRLLWGALPLIIGTTSLPSLALADAPPSVAQARQLFADALKEEEAGKFSEALAKLQRVQSVRDTSPVRYQIARCTENLGRIAKARELYLRTVDGTQIPSNEDPSVATASREAAARLAGRVGYVRIDGPATRGPERLVSVDEDEWAGAGLREVDPGDHALVVRSDDGRTRTIPFSVTSGATSSVKLFPKEEPPPPPPPVVAAKAAPVSSGSPTPWAWVSLGAGAALVGGGVAMLLVREGDIASITDDCPGNRCPGALRDDIESKQSRASTLGVLGVSAMAVGAAGLAVGTGLLLFGPRTGASAHSASVPHGLDAWMARSGVAPLPGGAQLFAGASF